MLLVPTRTVVGQLVGLIGAGVEPLFHALPDRPFEEVRAADIIQAHATLGWKPRTSLSEGLARSVNWYSQQLREHNLQ